MPIFQGLAKCHILSIVFLTALNPPNKIRCFLIFITMAFSMSIPS